MLRTSVFSGLLASGLLFVGWLVAEQASGGDKPTPTGISSAAHGCGVECRCGVECCGGVESCCGVECCGVECCGGCGVGCRCGELECCGA